MKVTYLVTIIDFHEIQEDGFIFHAQKDPNRKMSKETVRNHWNKILEQVEKRLNKLLQSWGIPLLA